MINDANNRIDKYMPRISDKSAAIKLTEKDLTPNYLNLRNAIVLMAITDLSQAYRDELPFRNEYEKEKLIRDCESFFRSEWFESLFNANGEYLIKLCKEGSYHNDFITRHSVLDLP